MITLNNLNGEYFSDYRNEFSFIQTHLSKYGKVPDLETFVNQFSNFPVIKVTEPSAYLIEELFRDRNKRFLTDNFKQIRKDIMEDDIDGAMAILQQAAQASTSAIGLQAVDLLHDKSRYERYLEKVENPNKFFVKTGFKELDEIICGWDTQEDLATIVARNGLGKSWVLLRSASAAVDQGLRVGIYSGEMSEDAIGYRIDTLRGHISNGALVHGSGAVKNSYAEYLNTLDQASGQLFVITPKTINGTAGVTALRAFIEKYDLDILFVDQHSLLEDDNHAVDTTTKAANISRDLKILQSTKRIPIVCVSQQNRTKADEGKSFDTTQIAQSDRIGQDSSVVIFIERDDNNIMKLHLVKSRQSGCGQVLNYRIDLNTGMFTYIPDDTSTAEQVAESGYSEDEVF